MAQRVLDVLQRERPAAIVEVGSYVGDEIAVIERDQLLDVMTLLRDHPELRMNMLSDVTCVDYLGQEPRFEVVYILYSTIHKHRVRVKVRVAEAEGECWVPSVANLWWSANWGEREAWDMYGVRFEGHPDPRRILMYEEFVGHPLRKDYPQNARQPLIRRPDAPTTDDQTTRLAESSHDRRVS